MKEQTLNVICDNVNHNKSQLAVRFIIPMESEAGKPATQATTIVTMVFADKKEASEFLPGNNYIITIAAAKKPYR